MPLTLQKSTYYLGINCFTQNGLNLVCLILRTPAKIQEKREKSTDNYSLYKRVLHLAQQVTETHSLRAQSGNLRDKTDDGDNENNRSHLLNIRFMPDSPI